MAAHQALPSLRFSRQEYWSGLPFPSPMHESEKVKVKSFSRVRLFTTPWTAAYQAPPSMGFSGKSTGVSAIAFSSVAHNSVHLGVRLQWHFSIYLHLWPTFFSRQGRELFFLSERYADGSPPKEIPHDLIQDATPVNACVILAPFPPALGISSLFHPSSTPLSFLYSDKDSFSSSHSFYPECRSGPREIKS